MIKLGRVCMTIAGLLFLIGCEDRSAEFSTVNESVDLPKSL